MEEYSKQFTLDSIFHVKSHDAKVTEFFDREIRLSEDDEPSVETLEKFQPIYKNMMDYLNEAITEMKAMEVMGMALDEAPESDEEEAMLEELLKAIHILTRKIEIILEFFLSNLGEEIVVEVLDLE